MQNENEVQSEDPPYHVKYYEDNKDIISSNRKVKYHTDARYREKLRRKARERYNKKFKSPDKKVGYTVKVIDGVPVFTIKYVLGVINKGRDFLETWEKRELIPKSTYIDSRGWRLYTQSQIDLLDYALGKYDDKEWDREEVAAFLHSKWED